MGSRKDGEGAWSMFAEVAGLFAVLALLAWWARVEERQPEVAYTPAPSATYTAAPVCDPSMWCAK